MLQQLFFYFYLLTSFILIIIEVFCLVMAYKHSQLTKKKNKQRKNSLRILR